MFEEFGFETLTAPQAAVWFGVALGIAFGALAQITRFCFRRAVAGDVSERRAAAAVWLTALAVALVGTQMTIAQGFIAFNDHRFFTADMPLFAIVVGGLLFGAGMVLTRGCVSRLTVLFASGNLRALTVLLIFAITAHSALKGILSPIRTTLGSVTVPVDAALPGGATLWMVLAVISAAFAIYRSRVQPLHIALAVVIGLLVPLGWVGTGYVLFDDFDPIAMESLSFTAPFADSLFWTLASTALPANFGVGLIGGALVGAFLLSLARREFSVTSFETPAQTARYIAGAMMMGLGGVLAGGCTLGAGLSGIPTLSVAALMALTAIALGAIAMDRVLNFRTQNDGSAHNAQPIG